MGLFEEFRERGWNTYYPDRATSSPQLDVTTAIVTYLAVVLAAAVCMIVVGTRGHEVQATVMTIIGFLNIFRYLLVHGHVRY